MSAQALPSELYIDFGGLAGLRRRARQDARGTLAPVARQFEALFLQMMLKGMRDATLGDPYLDSPALDTYRGMLDQQMALELARGRGIGIAEMLIRELGGAAARAPSPSSPPVHAGLRAERATQADGADPFGSPKAFIETLLPAAQGAARRLGVDPRLLLAQAALETGWGRAVPLRSDGRSSFNLFGIKADGRWHGERTEVATVEYQGGRPVPRQADFRVYGSFAESFADYAGFLTANPRYRQALAVADDPEDFMRAVQTAGYATDPGYADKVLGIWRREWGGALKLAGSGPIER